MATLSVTPTQDVFISSAFSTTNWDTLTHVVGSVGPKIVDHTRTLMDFDITAITAGSTIDAVTCNLEIIGVSAGSPFTWACRRERRSDGAEAQATWDIYKTANNWGTAGASNTTTDVDTTFAFTFTGPSAAGSFDIPDSAGFRAFVQDALDNFSGIVRMLLKHNTEPGTDDQGVGFYDSEDGTAGNRPSLNITYTAPGGAPRRVFVM